MAEFDEYSGIGALGGALKGAMQGWQDAEDRQMKRMEMEAKLNAQKAEKERNDFLDKMTAREKGFKKDPVTGQAVPDVDARKSEAYTKFAGHDRIPDFDENGNVTGSRIDPEKARQKLREAAAQGTGKVKDDPFSTDLRTKWLSDPTTKSTREVSVAYSKIQKAAQTDSAAGDMALIYALNKMMDPGSTVREGEFYNAESSRAVADSLKAYWNKLRSGERLTPEQRADFLNQAQNMYGAQMEQQRALNDSFKGIARRHGLHGEDIVLDEMFPAPAEPARPNPQGLLKVGLLGPQGLVKDNRPGAGSVLLPQANAGDGNMQVDPKIDAFAKANGVDYATAKAVYEERARKKAVKK